MTLEQIFFASQSIAAVGVIASLIFVGFQVRDSAKAVRSATAQAVHENFASWYLELARNPSAVDTILTGFPGLANLRPDQTAQFNCIFLAFLSHSQNAYHQWRQGHLAGELWTCWEALLLNMLHTPGGAEFWRQRSYTFAAAFQEEVQALIRRSPSAAVKAFGVVPLSSAVPPGKSSATSSATP